MKNTNNPAIDQFIIDAVLIDPIEKIILKLKNKEFRDCDINWLDLKIDHFITFAAKTFGINAIQRTNIPEETFIYLNAYALSYYEDKFNALLNYFKSFN